MERIDRPVRLGALFVSLVVNATIPYCGSLERYGMVVLHGSLAHYEAIGPAGSLSIHETIAQRSVHSLFTTQSHRKGHSSSMELSKGYDSLPCHVLFLSLGSIVSHETVQRKDSLAKYGSLSHSVRSTRTPQSKSPAHSIDSRQSLTMALSICTTLSQLWGSHSVSDSVSYAGSLSDTDAIA